MLRLPITQAGCATRLSSVEVTLSVADAEGLTFFYQINVNSFVTRLSPGTRITSSALNSLPDSLEMADREEIAGDTGSNVEESSDKKEDDAAAAAAAAKEPQGRAVYHSNVTFFCD